MLAVLRLGHRIERDKRLTTHVALVARAFGADKMFYAGDVDRSVELVVADVVKRWGGSFKVEYSSSWRKLMKSWQGLKVHLTMYGLPLKDVIRQIRNSFKTGVDLLVIVGGMKVPGEVFVLADYNVAVTSQPHSEAAALAVFLDWLHEGSEMEKQFENAMLQIIPSPKGKKVRKIQHI